jgi:hypothetical protein
MVCHKTNQRKLWSDSPTSGHLTDVCESMLLTEWRRSSDWIPNLVSKYCWLLIHHLETEHHNLEDWSDEDNYSEIYNSDDDAIPHSPLPFRQ